LNKAAHLECYQPPQHLSHSLFSTCCHPSGGKRRRLSRTVVSKLECAYPKGCTRWSIAVWEGNTGISIFFNPKKEI